MTLSHYFRLMDVHARMLLKAETSRYSLGILWWFLEPLLWVAVFYVVFNMIMDSGRRGGDFLVFLACGKLAFIWFNKAVNQASGSITASQGLVGKIKMPKSLFPMATVQQSLYRQSGVYLMLLAILLAFGTTPMWGWAWIAPVIVVFYLMIVASALVGAYLVCMWRDFQNLIPLGMTFLLFTSGVFWDVRDLGDPAKTELLLTVNPVAFMLDAHRQVLLYGLAPDFVHLGLIGLVSVLVIAAMAMLMNRYSHYLALKVLT